MSFDAPPRPLRIPDAALIERLAAVVGREHALTDPDQQTPYLIEWRDQFTGRSPLVLRPGSVAEVSQILKLANEARVAIVPQSGNTGLVGGQTPHDTNTEIVVSLARLRNVRAVDAAGYTLTVEAGLTLAEVQTEAEKVGRLFPLSLPSEGSCRIGGNLGTNAGGVGVLAYGNTRQLVLGVEVVLADGRVWDGLRAVKKDNAGYDLRDLFIGSEGTLGLITAAVLKLLPRPAEKATAMVAMMAAEPVLELFSLAQDRAGQTLTAFEFMPRIVVDMIVRNIKGTREPFATPVPWYVLVELSGAKADGSANAALESILTAAAERGLILDAAIAGSLAQARAFWRLREGVSEGQKYEGGNIKHDISVPVARIPEFLRRADAAIERLCPGARPIGVGHFGDGNIHYNIAQPPGMDKQAFLAMTDPIGDAVHALALEMNGSIAAEHGVGRLKRHALAQTKSAVEIDLMRRIKSVFDPNGILNPGKVL
jgi:FAD/FMN-containing dehydrogenase